MQIVPEIFALGKFDVVLLKAQWSGMLPPEDIEDILKGVEKHDDAYIDNYIALTEKRISSLNLFALIAALVAGAAVAELSSFDPKAWRSQERSRFLSLVQ